MISSGLSYKECLEQEIEEDQTNLSVLFFITEKN